MARAEFIGDGMHVVTALQTLYPDKKETEQYLVVNVDMIPGNGTITGWQEKIRFAVNQAGGIPRVSTCLVGGFDGKLREDQWAPRLEKAFESIGAVAADRIGQPAYFSQSGYAPCIPEWVQVGDYRINVNIAVRYSEYEDRTYVVLGSPVITTEY